MVACKEQLECLWIEGNVHIKFMSQCLSGSGCSKDQENYDWTTAGLNSELLIEVTLTAQFVQEISSNM